MSVATGRRTTDAVYLHPDDNICVAARNLAAGESLEIAGASFQLAGPVKLGHKIAVRVIRARNSPRPCRSTPFASWSTASRSGRNPGARRAG